MFQNENGSFNWTDLWMLVGGFMAIINTAIYLRNLTRVDDIVKYMAVIEEQKKVIKELERVNKKLQEFIDDSRK